MAERTDLINDADADDIDEVGAATGETTDETDQIRSSIEETRQEMGDTIRALEEKLSISNISEQVKEQVSEQITNAVETVKENVYDATVGRAGTFMKQAGKEISKSSLFKKAQANPLPLALISGGIMMLAYGGSGRRKHKTDGAYMRNFRSERSAESHHYQSDESTLKTAQKKFGDAYDSVSESAGNVYTGAGEMAQRTYKKVGNYGTKISNGYNHQIEENPLAVGAVALAVGALIGLAIPSTRYESELMGETRENLMRKVKESAGDLTDKVKDVANAAGKTISEEGKNQNSTL